MVGQKDFDGVVLWAEGCGGEMIRLERVSRRSRERASYVVIEVASQHRSVTAECRVRIGLFVCD